MPEDVQKPAAEPQDAQQPQKPERKLRPLPFNVSDATRQRFLNLFPKSNENALNQLLDKFQGSDDSVNTELEKARKETKDAIAETEALKAELKKLKEKPAPKSEDAEKLTELTAKMTELKSQLADAQKTIAELEKKKPETDDTKLNELQSKLTESEKQITELKQSIEQKDKMLKDMDKLTKGLPDVQKLKDRIGELEEQAKQDRKVMDGHTEQKKAYDDKIKELETAVQKAAEREQKLREQLETQIPNEFNETDEFLSAFPPLTRMLLQKTAEKLTESRRDGQEIKPSMVLADMFLKYTTQKRTMWFYRWVLSDREIVEIARQINPNINSVRMLRMALKIDNELN